MDNSNNQLSPECKDMLTKRLKMYENAAQVGCLERFNLKECR